MCDAAGRGGPHRLRVRRTPDVAAALLAASQLQDLPADVRAEAARCASGDDVPWLLLRRACVALRAARANAEGLTPEPWLQSLARTGGLLLHQPQPSRQRSAELERRVQALRSQAEERAYQELVRDVTWKEREERERVPLSSATRDVGFGMHVITLMFACFLAGLAVGRRLFTNVGAQFAVATVFMLIALLVETALFVVRDSRTHDAAARQPCHEARKKCE